MDDLKKQILELQEISRELEPSEAQRKTMWEELGTYSNDYLNRLSSERSYTPGKPAKGSFAIKAKRSLKDILATYDTEVADLGIRTASEGHLGYIPGGGIYSSALADYLAAITNEYAGISFASPGAVQMEIDLLDWLKQIFGFPATAIGNLTSGGSIANLIALTAARDHHGIKGDKIARSVIYLSPQVHHCIFKALRVIGLEDIVIRHLELDERFRIDHEKLSEKILADKKQGLDPFLVIASAGTTDTGAVDPLYEIGMLCQTHDLWYHVDAAYGGFFILSKNREELFRGIEMAHSLAVDPHKGLFLPFGLGAVLVKEREAVFHSHHHSANYMQDAVKDLLDPDPADVSPELTKHFRALRLWLPLQLHGVEPFVACLNEKLLLTRYFRQRLEEIGFRVGPEPDLSVSFFWWPLPEGDENDFNRRLLQEVHRDGRIFLSSTLIGEKFVIRMALLSFRTKIDTIEKTLNMLEDARKAVS